MEMKLSDCAKIVQGTLVGEDVSFASVSIDTRAIQPKQLYIAIKGKNFDGNEFVKLAQQAGAIAAIVHANGSSNLGLDSTLPHIIVDNTQLALAQLAGAWRKKLAVSVVGVTGSNGKTTVKEMIASILAVNHTVLFTQGNLNNDIGVPLTLLRLDEQHRYAVIEMGANHPKEIEYTSTYAAADVAVITNAGAAHIAGFASVDGVAKAKGEIIETLKADGVAILNGDDDYFDYWRDVAGNKKIISFGLSANADVTTHAINTALMTASPLKDWQSSPIEFITRFDLSVAQQTVTINLKLAGLHNVVNALAAAAACIALGIELEQIKQGLESVKPVTGRLQPLVSRLGNIVIDDSYNANAASLKAALAVLKTCTGKPWVILGAFGELGDDSLTIHAEMGALIKASGVIRLLAVGEHTRQTVDVFGEGASFFDSQAELISVLKQEIKGDETLLIKGSRAQRMENVAAALIDNFRT
jgi:UDP-N-acetylmuramoyl-tripeptide--D-alanyl-D-alanine ligase